MLGTHRVYGAVVLVTAAVATAASCGGDSETKGTGGGGQGGSTSSSTAASSSSSSSSTGSGGGTCGPTEGTTLAITKLYFGEGNNGQWKSFGFNIDGLVSDATSTDLCQPNSNAPAFVV